MTDTPPKKLSHLDETGAAHMVDVGHKSDTERHAVAEGRVLMHPDTFIAIRDGNIKKGDVLSIARLAGIMAAKKTADLIPLCHPLSLTYIDLNLILDEPNTAVVIRATARTTGKTGVEMESLTAVSTAALTIYDMAKAIDRGMRIDGIRLLEKSGGQSGHYIAED
jgi:cyclic pyranopterin phosphate synthase